jgi:sterol O-acyltransferase
LLVSKLYRRKKLLERKLKELETIESTKERSHGPSQLSHTTAVDNSDEDSQIIHRPNLGSRTHTDPHNESSQIGDALTAIDDTGNANAEDMKTFKSALHSEIAALDEELSGKVKVVSNQYPKNLTINNWADYTMLPTLVYELEYPRQESINWLYVAEKAIAALGGIWVMIVVSQAFIYPRVVETVAMKEAGMTLSERWQELPWVISDLLFPMLLEQLLTWWVIWECVLNTLAEVMRFSDRNFYGTWWNSVSWDQYARDWNRPVHNFLLRHVYNSSISSFHLSKTTATFVTFLLSALIHELLMFVIFKKVRGYLFTMQLMQLPLVSLSRTKLMRDRRTIGNISMLSLVLELFYARC